MSYTIHRAAVAEIREAAAWYAARSRVAALGFLDAVEQAIDTIIDNPLAWSPRRTRRDTRAFVLARFPFVVAYRVHADAIRILAVAHVRRRPDYWQRRR